MQKSKDNGIIRFVLKPTITIEVTDVEVRVLTQGLYPDDAPEKDKIMLNRCINSNSMINTINLMEKAAEKQNEEVSAYFYETIDRIRGICDAVIYDVIQSKHAEETDNLLDNILNGE